MLYIKSVCDGQLPGDFILVRYSAFFGVCRAGLSQQHNSSCLALCFHSPHKHILWQRSLEIIIQEVNPLGRERQATFLMDARIGS